MNITSGYVYRITINVDVEVYDCNVEFWFEVNAYPFHIQQHIVKLLHPWHNGKVDSIYMQGMLINDDTP